MDTDSDSLEDGPEVEACGTDTAPADSDGDGLRDANPTTGPTSRGRDNEDPPPSSNLGGRSAKPSERVS